MRKNSSDVGHEGHGLNATREKPEFPGSTLEAWNRTDRGAPTTGATRSGPAAVPGRPGSPGSPPSASTCPAWSSARRCPIGVYFLVRSHVHTDAQALIVAGCFSRRLDRPAVRPPAHASTWSGRPSSSGFALGVITSTLLGGNAYVLKVRDGFFTLLFGIACIVTLFTHDRPAFFYVSRYLSAGKDPAKVSAFDRLHELPIGRHTFRTLSVVWGIGLVVEASSRLILADLLPTGTFLAVSPFITAIVIGGLFAFTVVVHEADPDRVGCPDGARVAHDRATADVGPSGAACRLADERRAAPARCPPDLTAGARPPGPPDPAGLGRPRFGSLGGAPRR